MKRALLIALLFLVGCDGSPTEPDEVRPVSRAAVVGEWSGTFTAYPHGENWDPARMSITASESGLQGIITPKVGRARELEIGESNVGTIGVGIRDVYEYTGPGYAPCFYLGFTLRRATYRNGRVIHLEGDLGGRCPNTILNQPVRFRRLD